MAAQSAILLLPARNRVSGRALPPGLARAIGRADVLPPGDAGERAQLLRHFELLPRGWPAAALTRSLDAADVASAQWLRADPAWVRPDINGVRLFAVGEGMQLTRADADALVPALRTLFGDAGFPIDAPAPDRWYLRLPPGAKPPAFEDPDEAIGSDLFESLVGTGEARDAAARRWRTLSSEAQVILHNHPWNARRVAAGKPPVNSLWFWGGGASPDHVSARVALVRTDDALLRALALRADVERVERGDGFVAGDAKGDALLDLRDLRDVDAVHARWLLPAVEALRQGRLGGLRLDFQDGAGCVLLRKHRWRFWRKPAGDWSRLPPLPKAGQ